MTRESEWLCKTAFCRQLIPDSHGGEYEDDGDYSLLECDAVYTQVSCQRQ
jgi:hypothetical protein